MPKIKVPKSSPSIDMTPMVDLAFLLVTFFMLTATLRSPEPVIVDSPSSISEKMVPENMMMVTVDRDGRVFINITGKEARTEVLTQMESKYGIQLGKEREDKFALMTTHGCTMKELPTYLDTPGEKLSSFPTKGIPTDSLDNQLKDWIFYGNIALLNSAKTAYEQAKLDGKNPEVADFKPKYVLKVDSKALYKRAQEVIDIFGELRLYNLNFVTSLEEAPKN